MMTITARRDRTRVRGLGWGAAAAIVLCGCTRESVRVALETQRRADDVQQAVFDRQHEALCVLLYRDLLGRLTAAGLELSAAQREVLSAAWNERDLIEFWGVQHERARALRMIGVDARLFSEQSIVDLLWKDIAARAARVRSGLAAQAGQSVGRAAQEAQTPALPAGREESHE